MTCDECYRYGRCDLIYDSALCLATRVNPNAEYEKVDWSDE